MTMAFVQTAVEEPSLERVQPEASIEDPSVAEPPRLARIHAATNAIVERLLKRDPKRFQELAKTQQSGQ